MPPRLVLHEAARRGDVEALRAALRQNPDALYDCDVLKQTSLHEACLFGHAEAAAMLLQRGADVDAKDSKGATPLHCAASKGNMRCVQVLLKDAPPDGKRVNARNGQGLTPLHSAAKSGRNECILVMLVAGATLDAQSNRGLTPCDMAAGTSRPDVVRLLLGKGATMNRKGWQHYKLNSIWPSLIDLCSAAGFGGATATLDALKGLRNGELHEVARRGDLRRARYLLASQGADPNFPDAIGQTPLHEACIYGHTDMVRLLLDHHASPLAKDMKHSTPLHAACGSGNVECARSLLSVKSHSVQSLISSQTMNGLTPLHSAAKAGRLGAVELLLSQGAATVVNSLTKDQQETAVDLAAVNGLQLDVIRLLQSHGGRLTNEKLRAKASLGFSLPHLHKCVRGGMLMDAQDLIWRWRLMAGKTGQLHIVSQLVWFASGAIRVQLTSVLLRLLYFRARNAALDDSSEAHAGRIVIVMRNHIRHVCAMTIQHLLTAARWQRMTFDFASRQGALFFLKRVVRSHTSQMYYSAWKQWSVAVTAVGRVTNSEVRATEQRAAVAATRELEMGQLKQRATTFDSRVSATRCCAAVLVAGIVASRKAALWFRWRAAASHLRERCQVLHGGGCQWSNVAVGGLFRRWSTFSSTSWQMKARSIIERMFASRLNRYKDALTLWQRADLINQNRLACRAAEAAFSEQADDHAAFKTEMAQTVGRMSRELEVATKIADKVMGATLAKCLMNSDTGVQKRMLSHWREWSQQVDHLQALEEQRALQVEAERQQSMAVARIALERADADEAIKLAQSVTQAETARTAIRKLLQIKLFAGWRQWLGFIDHMQREATLDLLKDLESEHNHKTQHLLQKSSAASIFAFCGRVTEHCISYALYLWRERVLSVELCGLQTDLKSSLTAQQSVGQSNQNTVETNEALVELTKQNAARTADLGREKKQLASRIEKLEKDAASQIALRAKFVEDVLSLLQDTITGKMREMQSVADDLNERADKRAVRLAGEVVLSVGSKTVWHGLVEGMIAWKLSQRAVVEATKVKRAPITEEQVASDLSKELEKLSIETFKEMLNREAATEFKVAQEIAAQRLLAFTARVMRAPMLPTKSDTFNRWWLVHGGGHIFGWGDGEYGNLGANTSPDNLAVPSAIVKLNEEKMVRVAPALRHTLALSDDGDVYAWGTFTAPDSSDKNEQIELAWTNGRIDPIPRLCRETMDHVSPDDPAVAIAAHSSNSMVLTRSGKCIQWRYMSAASSSVEGEKEDEETDEQHGDETKVNVLSDFGGTRICSSIACGRSHCVALGSDGIAFAWGSNTVGQLGIGSLSDQPCDQPVQIVDVQGITKVSCGDDFSVFIADRGATVCGCGFSCPKTVGCLGRDAQVGYEGNQDEQSEPSPTNIVGLQETAQLGSSNLAVDIACGSAHTVLVTANGSVYTWGLWDGEPRSVFRNHIPQLTQDDTVTAVSAGRTHSAALTQGGKCLTWGGAEYTPDTVIKMKAHDAGLDSPREFTSDGGLPLGHGDMHPREHPQAVDGLGERCIVSVHCGEDSTFAVTAASRVLNTTYARWRLKKFNTGT